MEVNNKKHYVNYNDKDNPVPGSAADVAKRQREARALKTFEDNKDEIDKASEKFPAFGRIMDALMKK